MSEIMTIDTEKATQDPESVFTSPAEIVEHVGLTRGQKIATLDRWGFAVRARVDALSEGMTSRPDGAYSKDVELLRQIEREIDALRSPASAGDPRA